MKRVLKTILFILVVIVIASGVFLLIDHKEAVAPTQQLPTLNQ